MGRDHLSAGVDVFFASVLVSGFCSFFVSADLSQDASVDNTSDEFIERESISPIIEEGTFIVITPIVIFNRIIFIPFCVWQILK